jgi:alkylation response protein AidB-like acyl-CoA dehydrogenase
MYSFSPSPEQLALQKEIRAFAAEHLQGGEAQRDQEQRFDRDLWQRCGEMGLPGLAIPKEHGGRGLDPLSTLMALEALGYGCSDNGLNFAISAHLLACVIPLWLHGSEDLKQQYLPALCTGELIAANAMSEPASGSDAFRMKTLAQEEEGGGYQITGTKNFVSNGPVSDVVLLYAATDPERGFLGGITSFWLDKTIHSYEASPSWDKSGLRSCPLGAIYLDHICVSEAYVVGRVGRGAMVFNQSMEWERACLGGCHLGNMQRLLDQSVRMLRESRSQGREAGQVMRFELASLQTQLDAARMLAYSAAWKMSQGKPANKEASMSKLLISELYKSMTIKLASLHGEAGYWHSDLERSQRDAMSSTLYSGTSEMQKTIIAQSMGL